MERCLGRGRDRKRGEHPKDASLCFATGEETIGGYDKRGGAVRLAEGSVLFVNWQGQQKCKTYFDRKYPNALRADGTVTWWPPKNFDEERLSEPLHLFGRQGKTTSCISGAWRTSDRWRRPPPPRRRFSIEARRRGRARAARRRRRRAARAASAARRGDRCCCLGRKCGVGSCCNCSCCLESLGTRPLAGRSRGGRVAVGRR